MKVALFISVFVLVYSIPLYSQLSPEDDENVQQQIEATSEIYNEDTDYSDLLDKLNFYRNNPVNLNYATPEELKDLLYLNDMQINNLIEYRKKYGKLYSIYELEAIEGFYLDVINKILPFVYISENPNKRNLSLKNIIRNGKSRMIASYQQVLEKQQGYTHIDDSAYEANPNSKYLGAQQKLYFRYRYNYYDNVSFGITAKKDAGEEFFKGTQKNGFDFYSAHLFLKDFGKLKALAVGDYQAQFGQGLAFYSGLAFYGKSSEVLSVKKFTKGIVPYASSDENRFLRGIAVAFDFKKLEITGFFSQKNIDAGLNKYDSLTQTYSTNFASWSGGLHATPSQVQLKDNLNEKIFGAHISYKNEGLNLGITAFNVLYNKEINFILKPYNQFNFKGKDNTTVGFDYNYSLYNFNFFGEVARSGNNGKAFINGIAFCPDSRILLTMLYRNYAKDFQPLYSNAFSENSDNSNEKGIYTGMILKPYKNWTIFAYCDYFSFPWLKYSVNSPAKGANYLFKLEYKQINKLETYLSYRFKNKPANSSETFNIDNTDDNTKTNYRFNISYIIDNSLTIRNRIEILDHKTIENKMQKGYLIFQDLIYKFIKTPVILTFRYALFDTESYDERIYSYENSIPYSYSVPSYYYKGSRFYVMLKYALSKKIDFWIRYSQAYYSNKKSVGTGLDVINGNIKSDLMSEIRITF